MRIKTKLLSIILISTVLITSAEATNEQIQLLIKQGAFEKALVIAEEEISKNPKEIRVLFLKGIILARMDKLKQAESVFIDLTENYPELPEPFNNLAVIYTAKGDDDKAEQALRKAINTHPSYATAHENLGRIYAKMASQAYNNALKLDTDNQETKQKLSMISLLISAPGDMTNPAPTAQETVSNPTTGKPKPVKTKPEPKPEPRLAKLDPPKSTAMLESSYDKAAVNKEVEAAVKNWANAWSAKDVDGYVKSYSIKFVPPNGLSRNEWQAQRHIRLNKPKSIKVTLNNLKIKILNKDIALAGFTQTYQSDDYQDQVNKRLLMTNTNGIWMISKEEVD